MVLWVALLLPPVLRVCPSKRTLHPSPSDLWCLWVGPGEQPLPIAQRSRAFEQPVPAPSAAPPSGVETRGGQGALEWCP